MNHEDNERMCRVGPGTPMNAVFKRYWLPVATTEELRDAEPMRVTALGEHYVLFREGGQLALLREHCCHRSASLCLGRVEGGGIRCLYHGWKFAPDGQILEMPNVDGDRFKSRYRQPAYPVREIGGVIWTYLGPKEAMPPEPDYMWLTCPREHRLVTPVFIDCNYSQVLEGLIDSSHLGILHGKAFARQPGLEVFDKKVLDTVVAERTPEVGVQDTPFGFYAVAIRGTGAQRKARTSAFITPSLTAVTGGAKVRGSWGFILPIDDEHSLFFVGNFDLENDVGVGAKKEEMRRFQGIDDKTLERLGYSRATIHRADRATRHNNFYQDRDSMQRGSFTGLDPFLPEDIAVTVSMLPIPNRTVESLVPADAAITKMRRILLESAARVERGEAPIGVGAPATAAIFVTEGQVPDGTPWQALLPA